MQRDDRGRSAADCETARFAYQLKLGYNFPAYLTGWLRGMVEAAGEKMGVVVWKAKGARDDDALVVLRFADWQRLAALIEAPTESGARTSVAPSLAGPRDSRDDTPVSS
jgi:hypothetical protein